MDKTKVLSPECIELRGEIYDLIRTIRDPEKPQTLEELEVINENDITVELCPECSVVTIELTPTVPHCSLATIIGTCDLISLVGMGHSMSITPSGTHLLLVCMGPELDVFLKEGTHTSAHAVSRQINDKERIAAAMENPELRRMVEKCINEDDL